MRSAPICTDFVPNLVGKQQKITPLDSQLLKKDGNFPNFSFFPSLDSPDSRALIRESFVIRVLMLALFFFFFFYI